MKYRAKMDYRTTMQTGGRNVPIVIEKDEVVELDADVAAFIKSDCPKALVRAQGVKKNAAKKPAAKK